VGLKRDAIIPPQDLDRVDPEYIKSLAVGDELMVSVVRTPMGDDDLLVSLSKGLSHETWAKAEELAKSEELVELKIVEQNRGGLLVDYDNLRGFIPNSHIPAIRRGTGTQKAGEIKAAMIGKVLPLKVIEVNPEQHRLVFSARVAQKDQRQKRIQEINVGDEFDSRVVNVVDFGVFVDLNGVDGLVHKSELDWERVNDPAKSFKMGDEIRVKVVGIDKEKERISLSRKALLPNPWLKLVEKYHVGDLVEGRVVSVLDFGAFVELEPGVQGLVHVSEIGYMDSEDPKSVVKRGDQVLVKIISIEPNRERISLSMRRVPVSEQMDWLMNLEEVRASDKLEGVELDFAEDGSEKGAAEQQEELTDASSEIEDPSEGVDDQEGVLVEDAEEQDAAEPTLDSVEASVEESAVDPEEKTQEDA
jgi:small subunit ribosomal protein S1